MTMYDYEREILERERERERAILKTFSYFFKLLQTNRIFPKIWTFSHDSNVLELFILFNKP